MNKNIFKNITIALMLVVLLMFAAACGNTQDAPKDTGKDSGEKAGEKVAKEPKEVVIGFTGPLSGPAAQYGQDNVNGIELGIEDINEKGGITIDGQKYTFRLEAMDDQADPTQTINNARRMRDQYDVPVIFNPVFSSIAPLMEINTEKDNEFLVMAYSSTPAILGLDNPLTVRIPPSFLIYVNAFADIGWDEGWRKGAMLVTLGGYGDEWREAFREVWEAKGGEIVADQPANYYAETDYSTQLSAILATNPDFILIGGPSEPTALVVEQARDLGYQGPLLLVDQAKQDHVAKILGGTDQMKGVMGVPATADVGTSVAADFKKKYEEKYDVINTWEAVWEYDAVHALVLAMEEAGSVDDPAAIRAAFPKVFPLTGDKYPAEMFGIGPRGAIQGFGGVQRIDANGEYTSPINYIWWTDSEDVLNEIKGISQVEDVRLMKVDE